MNPDNSRQVWFKHVTIQHAAVQQASRLNIVQHGIRRQRLLNEDRQLADQQEQQDAPKDDKVSVHALVLKSVMRCEEFNRQKALWLFP